jgi:hypothetical protein
MPSGQIRRRLAVRTQGMRSKVACAVSRFTLKKFPGNGAARRVFDLRPRDLPERCRHHQLPAAETPAGAARP